MGVLGVLYLELNISVSLVHVPTGIRVQCHAQRSRESNRKEARRILREKVRFSLSTLLLILVILMGFFFYQVDLYLNPGMSKLECKWNKKREKKAAKKRQQARRRLQQQTGNEEDDGKKGVLDSLSDE